MPKYRNITPDTLWVDLGGRFPKVGPGEICEFPDDYPCYVQTGETGEPPIWELVTAPTTKKSAPAEKE